MTRIFLALTVALVAVLGMANAALPAAAANQPCLASPAAGPIGTTFSLTVTGFVPNAPVWLYAVDPNGGAFADPSFNDFGGAHKSDQDGNVAFTFATRFALRDFIINRALGAWTLVAEQRGLGGVITHQANCEIRITSGGEGVLSGATLSVTPNPATAGGDLIAVGSGFGANEWVNLWQSPPPGCSGFAFILPLVLYQYSTSSGFSQATVKADGAGALYYVLPTTRFFTCTGEWALSARGVESGRGAIARFTMVGGGGGTSGDATLYADHTVGYSRADFFQLTGSGYSPLGTVTCWLARPSGTVKPLGTFNATSSGAIQFSLTTGFDFEGDFNNDGVDEHVHYSEGAVGAYTVTCRDDASGVEGIAAFTLNGMITDP